MIVGRALRAIAGAACVIACGTWPAVGMAEPSEEPFELVPGSFLVEPSVLQAGAHEDLTTKFDFVHDPDGKTHNDVRGTIARLSAGFNASNTAVPTCSFAQLIGGGPTLPACPLASQVGQISVEVANIHSGPPGHFIAPIYNMEVTSFGVAAELGFKTILFSQVLQVSVNPDDLSITATGSDIRKFEPRNISVTIWGLPASHIHDAQRGATCGEDFEVPPVCTHPTGDGGPQEAGIPVKPFLSNPTSCGMFTAMIEAYSWEDISSPVLGKSDIGPIEGCDRVPFEPSIEMQPTTKSAESPSGFNASVVVPQAWDNANSLSTSNLKDAVVKLPVGFTINPSAGSGLAACSPAQFAAETSSSLPGEGCPPESKIGSIEIETPILAEKIIGAVYVATPFDNPFDALLSLYVVAKVPDRGIVVKVAGHVEPDPVTGQLVTRFLNNPQQPFSRFTLKFRPGATAPLASPPACGAYHVEAELTPWSAPTSPRPVSSPPFEITHGVHEGSCPSGGVPPLEPQLIAGTQNNEADAYSPFYLRIIREDGEQELTRFNTVMPPGLTGNLSGIPFCPGSAIEAARKATGREELAKPSCPTASEIGHTIVGAGVGTVLAQTPGKIYLAGPYHGSALSLVSVTSATVGPFDLGTVVIRFALRVNPTTAQVEVDANGSDPIPHIIDGIVVHVRDIRVYVDRPSFIVNPSNCQRMSIVNTITGAGADYTNPADQMPVSVSTQFQVADCSSLGFKPVFKVSTNGKTSRSNGASLMAKLTYPKALRGTQANIRSVKVDLPKQLPSRLTTLQKACTDNIFETNPAGCPAASRVGVAKAITPILPVPLEGPAYFVSHGGAKFPELIIVLQGYGITIDLHGETFISKKGITSSTFRAVPDQPVTSFVLTLPQGPNSALAANGNLCAHRLRMPTAFTAQNGRVLRQSTPISVTGCAKKRKAARTPKSRR